MSPFESINEDVHSQYHSVEISVSRGYPFTIHPRLLETVIQICFDVVIVNKSTRSSCTEYCFVDILDITNSRMKLAKSLRDDTDVCFHGIY